LVPQGLVKAGLKHLPSVLKVNPTELDTTTVLAASGGPLFVPEGG